MERDIGSGRVSSTICQSKERDILFDLMYIGGYLIFAIMVVVMLSKEV